MSPYCRQHGNVRITNCLVLARVENGQSFGVVAVSRGWSLHLAPSTVATGVTRLFWKVESVCLVMAVE